VLHELEEQSLMGDLGGYREHHKEKANAVVELMPHRIVEHESQL
jgi:hypothetical protein